MKIRLVTGGARSGKSGFVEGEARRMAGDRVTYVATARVTDVEMQARVDRHRARRPGPWELMEAPLEIGRALRDASNPTVIVDCLTLLVSNAILEASGEQPDEPSALAAAAAVVDELLGVASEKEGTLYVVTNEVGSGVVPATPLGRWFRDAQGWANQRVAREAVSVTLLVSGIAVAVKGEASS